MSCACPPEEMGARRDHLTSVEPISVIVRHEARGQTADHRAAVSSHLTDDPLQIPIEIILKETTAVATGTCRFRGPVA